jgi:hypothetical protein
MHSCMITMTNTSIKNVFVGFICCGVGGQWEEFLYCIRRFILCDSLFHCFIVSLCVVRSLTAS